MEPNDDAGESALWERARVGDQPAFGSIFDLHKDRVFRHAFRLLTNRHDAEDALGAVFFELWRRRRDVRMSDGSVLPWLLVTTTNTALNMQRATRRYAQLLNSLPHDMSERSAEEEAFLRSTTLDPVLMQAIRSLGVVDQGLTALVFIEDYSIEDAAAALGISGGAARTRLSRLRAKLRNELRESPASNLAVEGSPS